MMLSKYFPIYLGLGLGVAYLKGRSKKRKSTRKTSVIAGNVRFFAKIEDLIASAKAVKGCFVLATLRPAAVDAWSAAAFELGKQYPTVVFLGTSDPVGMEQQPDDVWHVGAFTGFGNDDNQYEVTGEDLDALALEMENAALHCPGVS